MFIYQNISKIRRKIDSFVNLIYHSVELNKMTMQFKTAYLLIVFCLLKFGFALSANAQTSKPINNCVLKIDSLKIIASSFVSNYKFDQNSFDNKFEYFYNKYCNADSAEFLYTLGYAHFLNRNYVSAIKYSLQSLNLAEFENKKPLQAEILLQVGYCYFRLSYTEKAIHYFSQTLDYSSQDFPEQSKSRALMDIGNAYYSNNKPDSALYYYNQAYQNSLKNSDNLNVVKSLINIGNLYISIKDFKKAEITTTDALNLSIKYKFDTKIICFFNLAELYYKKNQLDESKKYFEMVMQNIVGSNYESLIPEVYKYFASMDYMTKNNESAIQNCRLFQENTGKYYSNEKLLGSLHLINKILITLYNYSSTKELISKNIFLTDSVFKVEFENKKNLEESFQYISMYEKNYKILKQENIINKEKLKLIRVINASVIIFLVLISILMLVLNRTKNRIRRQNDIIRMQLRDITEKNDETNKLNHQIVAQAEKIAIQNDHLTTYQDQLEKLIEERTQELTIALVRARESDNLKTSFLQNISHEIRTPLNAISGFSQLMISDDLNKEQYFDIINQNIYDLIDMVENIMVFSKIHSNQLKLKKRKFKISSLIREIEIMVNDIRLKYKNSPIEFSITDQLDEAFSATSDATFIKKILLQLIENSFKFTEKGLINLNFSANGEKLDFSVSDTGIGIKKDQIPNIFDTFRKIEGEHKLFRGTGIGLAIVKKLTQQLDGEIFVESEYQKGTIITIKIPHMPESVT